MGRLFNIEFVKGFKKTFTSQIISDAYQGNDTLSGKKLLALTPSKQLNFLVMKVLFQQWQSEMKRLESPYFDYKDPDVKKALVQFMNVLSQHIEVSSDVLTELLSTAIDEALIIVTDPAKFIKNEFSGKSTQPYQTKHAKPILKYLKLLSEEFEDFFNFQATGSYSEVFEIAEDYFADVDLMESQDKLFSDLSEVTSISIENVLDEEEFVDITRIDEDLDDDFDDEIQDVAEAEVDLPPPAPEQPEPRADEAPDEVTTPTREETSNIRTVYSEDLTFGEEKPSEDFDALEDEPVAEVIEQDTAEYPEEEPEVPIASKKKPLEPTFEPEGEIEPSEPTLNDQFSKASEVSLAEKLEQEEKPGSISSGISVNQKYMFVQELFGADANAFQTSIAEIENFSSFDEAVEYLVTNYARQFDWDMNSDEVKELLKVVFRRFR